MMISYIILADGPATAKSFRPNDDQSQWWSRRDALVRITNMACYHGQNISNSSTDELIIFFNELSSKRSDNERENCKTLPGSGGISVAVMDPTVLTHAIATPTEHSIIKAWRSAFQKAEHSKLSILRKSELDFTNGGGVVCSHSVWTEAGSLLRLTSGSSDTTDNSHKKRSLVLSGESSYCKRIKVSDLETMGKKELVAWLQATCSIEFLREHHLNASETIVLKKMNREKLVQLYHLWVDDSSATQPTENTEAIGCEITSGSMNEPPDDLLIKSFLVLLSRCCQDLKTEDCTILLLHEDYSNELPVFSSTTLSLKRNGGNHHCHKVICVLGGVRDAVKDEITALLIAADRLGIRCVGANLGRTAEFTSKIIAAMSSHAAAGRLLPAIESLPIVTLEDGAILPKLLPIRKGNSTWDGRKIIASVLPSSNIALESVVNVCNTRIKIIATVNFASTQIVNDTSIDRETLQPFIQLIVNGIWKSRMISEVEEADNNSLDCCMDLLFTDNVVLHLQRAQIAKEVTKLHSAAPSEYQILLLMKTLLADSSNVSHLMACEDNDLLVECFKAALPSHLSKRDRKQLLTNTSVLHIVGVQAIGIGTGANTRSVCLDDIQSLSTEAYGSECSCSQPTRTSSQIIYIALDPDSNVSKRSQQLLAVLCQWKYGDSTRNDDPKFAKSLQKLRKKVITRKVQVDSSVISCGKAVAIMQHFAYHDRLIS